MLKKQLGFTLVEVLIALSIFAFSLTALVKYNADIFSDFSKNKEKTFANIILNNLVIEIKLSGPIVLGIQDGEYEMADKTWYYRKISEKLPDIGIDIIRTTISLFSSKEHKNNKKAIDRVIIYSPTANS